MGEHETADERATARVGPPSAPEGTVLGSAQETVPSGVALGRYLVIEELGRGGMGIVLRGYDPKLQREVALKIVRRASMVESMRSRLVREARAMAKLSHPNVVAVYDVELGEDGAADGVIVVMEYVPGRTLRQWLDEGERSWRDVLWAFVAAGRGLAAAHAQGLLHRDFKLDNVLVGTDERVRVSDFGLARAVSGSSSGEPSSESVASPPDKDHSGDGSSGSDVLTEAGMVMGTPLYMAPEHYKGGTVDARSDQYSFCVGLWRALTGQWPFPGRRYDFEARKKGAPPWPSKSPVPRFVSDAIRRGLEPEPADRWSDIDALLSALTADPHRRRRVAFVAVGVAAVAAAGWGWQGLEGARTRAACGERGARAQEVWNDARAETIGTAFAASPRPYAADSWERSKPRLDRFAEAWTKAAVGACEEAALGDTPQRPAARARQRCLREMLADVDALVSELESPDDGAVYRAAVATASLRRVSKCDSAEIVARDAGGPVDEASAEAIEQLEARLSRASAARHLGRFAAGLEHAEAVRTAAVAAGEEGIADRASVLMGVLQGDLGHPKEGKETLEAAFFSASAGGRDRIALSAAEALVSVLGLQRGELDEAMMWGRLGRTLVERLELEGTLAEATLLAHIAVVEANRGNLEQSLEMHQRELGIREAALGREHPDIARSLHNIALAHFYRGEYDQALEYATEAYRIWSTSVGPEHPALASFLVGFSAIHIARGEYDEGLRRLERALELQEKGLGPEHPELGHTLNNIASAELELGHPKRAIAALERGLSIQEKALGVDDPNVARTLSSLGAAYREDGDFEAALASDQRALRIQEHALGQEHADVAWSYGSLAQDYRDLERPEDARAAFERAREIYVATVGLEHPDAARILYNFARFHVAQGELQEALPMFEHVLGAFERGLGPEHPMVAETLTRLGDIQLTLRQPAEAVSSYERALAVWQHADGGERKLAPIRFALARALRQTGADSKRALSLARQAREDLAQLDPSSPTLRELDAWLAARDDPGGH